jgi:aryl-alcohol dehydrogenase-like predicted oxidoreductase
MADADAVLSGTDSVLSGTYPVCLGTNIFGWTIDEQQSFEVLDAYARSGGNFVDTADVYSAWAEGNTGGESETIIGNWMHARDNRDEIKVATKVGQREGLSPAAIRSGLEDSLRRLRTDRVDLYYVHVDDEATPLHDTLAELSALIKEGKVLEIGASGYTAPRLAEALAVSDVDGLRRYRVVQPLYNLLERENYEGEYQELCEREGIACVPFFGLARGFLTGKYRPGLKPDTERGGFAWTGEWDDRTLKVLGALDDVAARLETSHAAVALAWLRAQPTVVAPIASARTVEQLREIAMITDFELEPADIDQLTGAGRDPA